jgi:hypothetical protein
MAAQVAMQLPTIFGLSFAGAKRLYNRVFWSEKRNQFGAILRLSLTVIAGS